MVTPLPSPATVTGLQEGNCLTLPIPDSLTLPPSAVCKPRKKSYHVGVLSLRSLCG